MRFLRTYRLSTRFFWGLAVIIFVFISGMVMAFAYLLGYLLFLILSLLVLADIFLLKNPGKEIIERNVPERFSNGEPNPVKITVWNPYNFTVQAKVVDEPPEIFQIRDQFLPITVPAGRQRAIFYKITPNRRGLYRFGSTRVLMVSPLGLVERHFENPENHEVKVYPAFRSLKRYEMMALVDKNRSDGARRVRVETPAMEYDQIREYVMGDDPRSLNWAATARRDKLMVNQYVEERSQPVYSVIDAGRIMKMPFDGMTLLDYSVNAALALSKIAILKNDRPGLITFSRKMEKVVKADHARTQFHKIVESLYHLQTGFLESDYEALYAGIRTVLPSRSTLLMFTNVESVHALRRLLPVLEKINKRHLLLVTLFRNSEIASLREGKSQTISALYEKAMAEAYLLEKENIVKVLRNHGIRSILVKPAELTATTINQYLMLKRRHLT